MSLVAAYTDSESEEEKLENDESSQVSSNTNAISQHKPEVSELAKISSKNQANLLLSATADSDSDESDDDEDAKKRKQQSRLKLDNPFRTFGGTTNVSREDSVFRNPFREKEEQKIAVLEHHVKMTDNPETALKINGKKICWNYRKRKCYLGTQCPYAHDSDVPLTEEQLKEQKAEDDLHRSAAGNTNVGGQKNPFAPQSKSHLPGTASVVAGGYDSSAFFSSPHLSGSGNQKNVTSNNNGEDAHEQPYSKSNVKKRVGLTNSLIPPKKALNLYHKTKDS